MRSSLTLAAALALASVPAGAQDAASVLARAERTHASVGSLRAAFTQILDNPMLGTPDTSRGHMFLRRPDRFAMRFTVPAGDRLVADGQYLWIYTPSTVENQVIRQPMPAAGAVSPNFFDQFARNATERYSATLTGSVVQSGDTLDLVRLEPRTEMPFREATIGVSRATGLIMRVSFVEESRQRRTLILDAADRYAAITDSEVSFVPARGVRVVEP